MIQMNSKGRYVLALLLLLFSLPAFSQEQDTLAAVRLQPETAAAGIFRSIAGAYEIPEIEYVPKPPPQYWSKGILSQFNFTQISLANWADGGGGSLALNAYFDIKANYAKDNIFWENRLQLGYGFIQALNDIYKKSDDKIIFDSKFGYKAVEKLFISSIFNFKTQFTPGFKYPAKEGEPYVLQSTFLAPANITIGLGADYKPFTSLSINFAPATGNFVIVENKSLRTKYGNKEDQAIRVELGAQFKADYVKKFGDKFGLQSSLTLFSDFLDSPQNIRVNWDMVADWKLTRYITLNLRTNLIYDDKILIEGKDGSKKPQVQFRETFGVGLSYTFGGY